MLQLWPSISASAVAMVGSENSSATTITVSTRGNAEQYHDECGQHLTAPKRRGLGKMQRHFLLALIESRGRKARPLGSYWV
jgi:hypothetical protein